MRKLRLKANGPFSGKVGNVVGYIRNGKQYIRRYALLKPVSANGRRVSNSIYTGELVIG